jgi:DNA-binding transcriptional ArsR family regulator
MKLEKDKVVGWFYVLIAPIILLTIIYYYFIFPPSVIVPIIVGIIYFVLLSEKVNYGATQIRKIRIPKAPEHIEEFLKSTTTSGDLIYVYLISVFGNDKKLSQTQLVNRVKEQFEVFLTDQTIRNHIKRLENMGLLRSSKGAKERVYTLTEQGLWCSEAIKICFPKTLFWFIIRHYIGIRNLRDYPKRGSQEFLPSYSN